jgi:hypothetical protein
VAIIDNIAHKFAVGHADKLQFENKSRLFDIYTVYVFIDGSY